MSNKPAAWESFILEAGKSKISMSLDTKIANAATFTIEKEDHTLANLLRMQISKNPKVLFVGYKIPRIFLKLIDLDPLENYFLLKIQTSADTTPKQVFQSELDKLIRHVEELAKKFPVFCFY